MTHPAITAAVTAARDFAEALEKAQAVLAAPKPLPALTAGDKVEITGLSIYDANHIGETGQVSRVDSDNYIVVHVGTGWNTKILVYKRDALELVTKPEPAPADPTEVKVGYVAATKADALALLGRLPEGAEVTDRDGDSWTVDGNGRIRFQEDPYTQIPGNATSYAPLTVTSLPAAEPEPLADWERELLAATPEPTPTSLDIDSMYSDRRITVEAWSGFGQAQITLTEPNRGKAVFAFFTKDQALQIAATLTAIADE